jgi:hypothetical protein
MKKIFFSLIIVFAVSFLFADRIVVDERDAENLQRLQEVYDSLGLEFKVVKVDPEKVDYDKVLSLDEVIENLEKTDSYGVRSDCILGLTVLKEYKYQYILGQGWILVWTGGFTASVNTDGWDGSLHWLETSGGTQSYVHKVYGPSFSYSGAGSYRYAKARAFEESWVQIGGNWYKIISEMGQCYYYDLNNL